MKNIPQKEILEAVKYASKVISLWLPYKIKYDKVPGISVGITYKGKLIYKTGYGYAKDSINTGIFETIYH